MDKQERLYTAVFIFVLFILSISLAWIWFDWKLAVIVTLSLMCASGNASLKVATSWRNFGRAYYKAMGKEVKE